jgi:hypothetical protein
VEITNFIQNNSDTCFNELNFKIPDREIAQAISKLKNGKACGKDSILNEMIKAASPCIIPVLEKLFNHILTTSTFPDPWRINFITPLHKKGSVNMPENYRGIATSSNLCKLFCSILHNRLARFFESNNIIPKQQIGYKSKCRTSDHIYTLRTIIDKYTRNLSKNNLYCCFVDFKSAFDTVWRDPLIYKLIKINVGGCFLKTIRSLYSNVLYCIKANDGISPAFCSNVGVKQGCVLSPILFNLYLSDLPNIFDVSCDPVNIHGTNISCLMFADYLILLSRSPTGLQSCIDRLNGYCTKWRLTINLKKTKVMVFSKSGRAGKSCRFTLKNQPLEITNIYCYLGINFSSNGNFKNALDVLKDKSMRAVFKLRQHNIRDNISTSLKLFNALVLPIIRYCCEVWSPFELKDLSPDNFLNTCEKSLIEKVNNKFCKYLLGIHKYSSNIAAKGELGLHGLLTDCVYHSIKYWLRLVNHNMDKESLVYKCYQENYSSLSSNSTGNWCLHMKNILNNFEFSNIWINQGIGSCYRSESSFLTSLKDKIKLQYESNWEHSIKLNTGKLRTFKLFKNKFGLENYLLTCKFKTENIFPG